MKQVFAANLAKDLTLTEYIPEGLLRVLWQLLRYLLIDLCIDILIYGYGYLILKIITLGRYPKLHGTERSYCIVAGVISVVATICVLLYWQHAG